MFERSQAIELKEWVQEFVHAFRAEMEKLCEKYGNEVLRWLSPYVKEQMLAKPCQVEVIQFDEPYRFLLVFFFDKSKPDLLINIYQEKPVNLDALTEFLLNQHCSLSIDYGCLHSKLESCLAGGTSEKALFGIAFCRGLFSIWFAHNPVTSKQPSDNPRERALLIADTNSSIASAYS